MKKMMFVILMILCGFAIIGGGLCLLTSCGTTSEQGGEIQMPDDDTNLDEGKEDSDDSTNDGDDGISDNSATDFTIYMLLVRITHPLIVLCNRHHHPMQMRE